MTDTVAHQVSRHFAPPELRQRVADVLAAAGKDASNTSIDELAPLDQWHMMRDVPTRRLAEHAAVTGDQCVLDVGCGMGGPARFLAATYGCTVTGVDITTPYLETAALLTELTGLTDRVSFQHADATDLPFADDMFDLVWTQHAAQSIPDKAAFFAELHRVLKRGGTAVIHDLYRGASGEIHFPAFWGRSDSISFLVTDSEMRSLLETGGFEVVEWTDTTDEVLAFNADRLERGIPAPIPGLNISLLFGDETMTMAANGVQDLRDGAVGTFEAVLTGR
ncbi:MAG TPA: methyltransferase domain-containing protein [Solirubrobacteraceae bacterium]|jgi:SAM-dependent methyltransferase